MVLWPTPTSSCQGEMFCWVGWVWGGYRFLGFDLSQVWLHLTHLLPRSKFLQTISLAQLVMGRHPQRGWRFDRQARIFLYIFNIEEIISIKPDSTRNCHMAGSVSQTINPLQVGSGMEQSIHQLCRVREDISTLSGKIYRIFGFFRIRFIKQSDSYILFIFFHQFLFGSVKPWWITMLLFSSWKLPL